MENVWMGWGAPLLVILVFLGINWRFLDRKGKFVFAGVIYAFSIATGILADLFFTVSDRESAMIAGVIAPTAYGLLFTITRLIQNMVRGQQGELGPEEQPKPQKDRVAEPLPKPAPSRKQWNPVIIAALIQAVATIIAAVLAR